MRQDSGSFSKPLPPKPRAMLLGSEASRGDRLVSHRCTNGCADTDLWNWVAVSHWGNLLCSSGALGWIPLKVQAASTHPLQGSWSLLLLCQGLVLPRNSHGVRIWSYFFSLTLFLLHLNCSASLVFLWVVSNNFCSPKSEHCCSFEHWLALSCVVWGSHLSANILCTAATRANP